ncbi:CHAT domain-containing protein [Nocardia salmonicida]|uniref:CHAT domain-containing protein n=1 Tax=Nocardia salmonicida TaxID=53431 RepID=UPI0033CAE6DB
MKGLPEAVRRVVQRNDVMMLAAEAEVALGIVQTGHMKRREFRHHAELFSAAVQQYCDAVDGAPGPEGLTVRLKAWDKAGVIVRLCSLLHIDLETPPDVDVGGFHRRVVADLEENRRSHAGRLIDRDHFNGLDLRHRAMRDLRLAGRYEDAIALAPRHDVDLLGAGADMSGAYFQYEIAAAMLMSGRTSDVPEMLRTRYERYWREVSDLGYPDRYLVDLAGALAAWANDDRASAFAGLALATQRLRVHGRRARHHELAGLLLSLTCAEVQVADGGDALGDLDLALRTAESIRSRWRVVSRSESPLSVAFRRLYGDLSRVAACSQSQSSAEVGLRVALSAKQSGLAARIRADRFDIASSRLAKSGRRVRSLIDRIVQAESMRPPGSGAASTDDEQLSRLRLEIEEAVSPMLAETVLPLPATVQDVVTAVGGRYALDYVALPDTLTGELSCFQTLIEPSGAISFHRVLVGKHLEKYLSATAAGSVLEQSYDWQAIGANLLPARLRDALVPVGGEPVRLVVSAHSALSLLPWAALRLNDDIRLVHRAIISQTPVLTSLSGSVPAPVTGTALIQLVSLRSEGRAGGVNVRSESEAWALRPGSDGAVPVSACGLEPSSMPVDVHRSFATALSEDPREWGFAHVAAHGTGDGLGQTLLLPGAPLSAAQALALPWPPAVLMASCHIGRLVNTEFAEPLNFVMAALVGGAECVVACIYAISDFIGGEIAAEIVRLCREEGVGLDAALRTAQLEWIEWPETVWASFVAYAR